VNAAKGGGFLPKIAARQLLDGLTEAGGLDVIARVQAVIEAVLIGNARRGVPIDVDLAVLRVTKHQLRSLSV
jgi:hypothetical protein